MSDDIKRKVEERVKTERMEAQKENRGDPEISYKFILQCFHNQERGDALLLCEIHRDLIAYFKNEKQFILFHKRWQIDNLDHVNSFVEDVCAQYGRFYEKTALDILAASKEDNEPKIKELEFLQKGILRRIKKLRKRPGMVNCIAWVSDITAKKREIFDQKPDHLLCGTDLVDLRTGFSRPCRPDDFMLTGCPTRYQQDVPDPQRFLQFLDDISYGRPEWVQGLQIVLGQAMFGAVVEEIIVICLGETASNGKSVLFEILKFVLGDLAITFNIEMLLYNRFRGSSGPNSDLIDLNGVRLAFGNEVPNKSFFEESTVKRVASVGSLKARRPYDKENTTFIASHTICLAVNSLPHATSYDEGFWRRIVTIPFDRKFVDGEPKAENEMPRNKHLLEALKKEATGILAWLIQGCLLYQEVGLVQPDCFLKETAKFRRSEDLLQDFIDECCVLDQNIETLSSDLFAEFSAWYEQEVSKKGCSQRFFGLLMTAKFPKGRDKVTGRTIYKGIGLLKKWEP